MIRIPKLKEEKLTMERTKDNQRQNMEVPTLMKMQLVAQAGGYHQNQ